MILNIGKRQLRTDKGLVNLIDQINSIQAILLQELIVDGRKSLSEIAKENGLSTEDVKRNYDELEQSGVIKGSTIHINYRCFGYKAVAHVLVTVEPTQAEELVAYALKLSEVYVAYARGPKGNIDIIISIKSLRELEKVKDLIRKKFSVSEMKTVIWTDVRETNQNLSILPHKEEPLAEPKQDQKSSYAPKKCSVDEIDEKIADKLSKNGHATMEEIAKESGISTDTAKRRYDKLKKNGVLKVTIQFDPTTIGYKALGIFFAVTSNVDAASLIDKIGKIPDVISIMKTSGTYDLQIYAMIREMDHLLSIQDELGKIQGITSMDAEILRITKTWPSPRQYISTF
jgi:Lrp/AsnC family transcriptional regulator, leucine-responsive regulatory protein